MTMLKSIQIGRAMMQVVLVDVFVPSVNQRCKNHCYFNHHFFKAASQEQQKQQKSLT